MRGVQSHLFGGGPGRKRTCERRCRRRKSRRISPARPAEAEWGSAPGCSSPDPTQNNECQLLLAAHYFKKRKNSAYRFSWNVWLLMEMRTDSLRWPCPATSYRLRPIRVWCSHTTCTETFSDKSKYSYLSLQISAHWWTRKKRRDKQERQTRAQTFPHDVVKELHDGDPAVRVAVEQLGVHSGCEEFSDGQRGEK